MSKDIFSPSLITFYLSHLTLFRLVDFYYRNTSKRQCVASIIRQDWYIMLMTVLTNYRIDISKRISFHVLHTTRVH